MSEALAPVLQAVDEAMKAEGLPAAQRSKIIARLLAMALCAPKEQA